MDSIQIYLSRIRFSMVAKIVAKTVTEITG